MRNLLKICALSFYLAPFGVVFPKTQPKPKHSWKPSWSKWKKNGQRSKNKTGILTATRIIAEGKN